MTRWGTRRGWTALLALLPLALGPVPAGGADVTDAGALNGVWHGTLGERRIAVCFDAPNRDGAYYDLDQPQRIALRPQPDGTWQAVTTAALPDDAAPDVDCDGPCEEGPENSGAWHLESPVQTPEGESVITGQRSGPVNGPGLPIRLTRQYLIDGPGTATGPVRPPCADLAFTAPFSKSLVVTLGEPRTFAGHRYRTRTLSVADSLSISGIELLEPGPHAAAISRALRGLPASDAETAIELYSCGAYTEIQGEIEFWSGRWLGTAEVGEISCGGVHPNLVRTHRTWDLESGEEVDLGAWIADHARDRLLELVLKRALSGPELAAETAHTDWQGTGEGCAATLIDGPVPWASPYLGLNGMVFATALPHVVQACDQEVEIPYAEVLPFATAAGRAAILDLLATLPTLPPPAPTRTHAGAGLIRHRGRATA